MVEFPHQRPARAARQPAADPAAAVAVGGGDVGWVFLGSDESGFLTVAAKKLASAVGITIERSPVHIFTWPGLLMLYFLEIMPVVYVIVGAAYRSTEHRWRKPPASMAAGCSRPSSRCRSRSSGRRSC